MGENNKLWKGKKKKYVIKVMMTKVKIGESLTSRSFEEPLSSRRCEVNMKVTYLLNFF